MEKFKTYLAKAKYKINATAIKMCREGQTFLEDTRGESQNTSNAGAIIVSLFLVAAFLAFVTGFAQNTFFPWVQNTFHAITGKGS